MEKIAELDLKLFYLFNHNLSNPLFDALMPFITNHVPLLLLPVIIFLLFKQKIHFLKPLVLLILALICSDSIVNILKEAIARPRPFSVLSDVRLLVGKGASYAMPSGHATNVFSTVSVLLFYLRQQKKSFNLGGLSSRALSFYLLLAASAVAFSRVYVGVHWPSDVIVGSAIGFLAGVTVFYCYHWIGRLLRERAYFRVTLVFLILISLFRVYYIATGPLDLSPDEAHYWDWSRNLQLSYYSKGPAIAYIIRAATEVYGNTVLGVRLPAVVFSFLSALVLYFFTREISRSMRLREDSASLAGMLSALGLQIIPLFSAFGIVNTIDAPLIFFWSLSLWLFWRALNRKSFFYWLLTGIAVGIGLLTKYTMAFFYISAMGYILWGKKSENISFKRSELLFSSKPWLGFLISLLLFMPVIIWNAQNNWVTFLHTAGQANIQEGFVLDLYSFVEFIGSQLGVITPLIFVLMLMGLISLKRTAEGSFLFWFSAPVLLFFLMKSVQGKVQANWPLPGYISAVVCLSIYLVIRWQTAGRVFRSAAVSAAAVSLLVIIVGLYPSSFGIPPELDPSARLRGWESLGGHMSALRKEMKRDTFIFSDNYQATAELAFYMEGNPRVYCVNLGRRMNQYDLWEGFYNLVGYDALFVGIGDKGVPEKLLNYFDYCEEEIFYVYENGKVFRSFSIGKCRGFKGMKKELPKRF
jgi:undecaprenyl-diphosphatase